MFLLLIGPEENVRGRKWVGARDGRNRRRTKAATPHVIVLIIIIIVGGGGSGNIFLVSGEPPAYDINRVGVELQEVHRLGQLRIFSRHDRRRRGTRIVLGFYGLLLF